MASKDPLDKSGDILDCAICLERLKVPKYLPCLHTFCESCLQTYIDSSIDNTKPIKSFPCPMCRLSVEHVEGESVTNTETWASQLPFNNMIFSLMEKSSEIEDSSTKNCDPCRRGGDVSKAVKWCTNCQDFLCDTCESIHSKIKATISHKVVSLFDRTSIEQEAIETEIPCKEHRGKYIEVFCVDHDRMCCVICLAVNHRQCKNIKTIDDMVAVFDDVPLQVGDTIKDVCATFQGFISDKEAAINEMKAKQEALDEQIDLEINSAIEKLKLVQSNSHEALNKICQAEFDSLQTELNDLTRRKISLGQLMQLDQLLRLHGTKKQRFFNSQDLKLEITDMVNNLSETRKSLERREICFTVNEDFKLLLSNNFKLCDIAVQRKTTDTKCIDEVASKLALILREVIDQQNYNYVRQAFENVKLKKNISINAKSEDDTHTPWLTGGSFLSDETCIFVDHNNKKLKVVMLYSGEISKEVRLDYDAVDIKTRPQTSQLFVSTKQKSIMVYLLDKQYNATLSRSIALKDEIWGFDFLDTFFYVYNSNKAQIEVFNLEGSFTKTLSTPKQIYNGYICCDTYSNAIVSSGQDYVLKINDNHGERFSDEILKGVRGVTFDRNGNIYVCGFQSHNVVLLDRNFKTFREIQLSDTKITVPYAIGFDKMGRKLFLTAYGGETSVEIYELD